MTKVDAEELIEGIIPIIRLSARMYTIYMEERLPEPVALELIKTFMQVTFNRDTQEQIAVPYLSNFGSGSAS